MFKKCLYYTKAILIHKSDNFQYFYIKSFVVGAHVLEVQGYSNTQSQHMLLWRNDVY